MENTLKQKFKFNKYGIRYVFKQKSLCAKLGTHA